MGGAFMVGLEWDGYMGRLRLFSKLVDWFRLVWGGGGAMLTMDGQFLGVGNKIR